jgi:hypothetical protein
VSESERLRELLDGARQDRKRLRGKLDVTQAELARVTAELEVTKRKLQETEGWLLELERARTWRLTAPLRGLSGRARRRGAGRGR